MPKNELFLYAILWNTIPINLPTYTNQRPADPGAQYRRQNCPQERLGHSIPHIDQCD